MTAARLVTALTASALAVATMAAAGPARADDPHERGATVAPARGGGLTGGELLGEAWAQGLAGHNTPFAGTCTTIARHVLVPHPLEDGTASCAGTPASRLLVFFGSECSNVEAPLFPQSRAAQLACAIASDRAIKALNISVDGGHPIHIRRSQFEVASPQRTVLLPADNFLGVPAGPATFTAHAWAAVIQDLGPGRHTVTRQLVAPDWGGTYTSIFTLDIAPGDHPKHDHDHHD
jgi:hypothetical protein